MAPYNTHERLNQLYQDCVNAREGVGKSGDWCIDFHQRFDLNEAMRGADLSRTSPYFVEDPVRTEAFLPGPYVDALVKITSCAYRQQLNDWLKHVEVRTIKAEQVLQCAKASTTVDALIKAHENADVVFKNDIIKCKRAYKCTNTMFITKTNDVSR